MMMRRMFEVLVVMVCLMVAIHKAVAVSEGEPAPAFTVAQYQSDTPLKLSDYAGKVVIVDFWASWCGPCAKSFPFYESLYQKYHAMGLEVIAVSVDEEQSDMKDFLAEHKASFLIGWDPAGELATTFKVPGMPTSYIIDAKGQVKTVHKGFNESKDVEIIEKEVKALLRAI